MSSSLDGDRTMATDDLVAASRDSGEVLTFRRPGREALRPPPVAPELLDRWGLRAS